MRATSFGVSSKSCGSAPAGVRFVTETVCRRSARPRMRVDRRRRRPARGRSELERQAAAGGERGTSPMRKRFSLASEDDNDSQQLVENGYLGKTSWRMRRTRAGAGQRIGAAGSLVIEYLDEQQCCRGAQEIHEALAARGSIGLASVYRALDGLVEQGLLQRVDFGDGIARYEPSAPGTSTTITSSARAAARSRRSTTPRSSARSRRSRSRPATTSPRTTSCCAAPAATAGRRSSDAR